MTTESKLIEDMRAAVSSAIHKCLGVWPDVATCDVVIADLSAVAFPAIREMCAAVIRQNMVVSTNEGDGTPYLAPRRHGDVNGLAYADAIDALSLDAPTAGGESDPAFTPNPAGISTVWVGSPAPASPSVGVREAVIEECADSLPRKTTVDDEWDKGWNAALEEADSAIRALALPHQTENKYG